MNKNIYIHVVHINEELDARGYTVNESSVAIAKEVIRKAFDYELENHLSDALYDHGLRSDGEE